MFLVSKILFIRLRDFLEPSELIEGSILSLSPIYMIILILD